jgi:hypothetical protein
MDSADYPFKQLGSRRAPDLDDVRAFARRGLREGGRRTVPTAARPFQKRAAAEIAHYPEPQALPRWVLALVEKKVSVEELARTVHDRTLRAPTEENQKLALLLANEIARTPDGPELLERHLTPELLQRLSGGGEHR